LHNTEIKQVNHVEILSMIFLCSFKELFFLSDIISRHYIKTQARHNILERTSFNYFKENKQGCCTLTLTRTMNRKGLNTQKRNQLKRNNNGN